MAVVIMITQHCKRIELDLDGKDKNEGVSAMNTREEFTALEGAQIRLTCIQYVCSMLDMLKP